MSLKKNIIANYISQIYVTCIGILILPLYIKYMGAEAYGLIGFFAMLQAWFNLFDLGLTPTISRETACFNAKGTEVLNYLQLFRSLNVIFIIIACIGGIALFLSSDLIASKWLNANFLEDYIIIQAIQVIAICVALRWLGGLYRGVVTGFEKLVWLSGFNIIIATLRFLAVFLVMHIYGYTVIVFFIYQLCIALLEFVILFIKTNQLLPKLNSREGLIGWSLSPVKKVLKFSISIAFVSIIGIFITQIDKLILSGILPLKEYGYFTLAVLAASGVLIVSGPISNSIMPRLSNFHVLQKNDELMVLYNKATQLVTVLAGTVTIIFTFCASEILYSWTGDKKIVEEATILLQLYAAGNGVLALSAFPYYLQYAKGNLYYHLIGNALFAVFLIPAIILCSKYYGAIGAGYAWVIGNSIYFIFWVSYVHKKLVPGFHFQWLKNNILSIVVPIVIVASLFNYSFSGDYNQMYSFIYVLSCSLILLIVGVFSSSILRAEFINRTGCVK
jgi:O-antigen/teichoic acid export membrane protein